MRTSKKRNGGFTLLEVLITVAILVIVLAFGIVGVARYRDYLKITELDNLAREIYMAAENRAVLLQNSGAAKSRVDALIDSVEVKGKTYKILTHAPTAASVTIASLAVPAPVDYSDELLPAGSIDPALREGHFCVLYDAGTGHVAEVFYAEKEEIQTSWFEILRKSRSDRVEAFRSDADGTPICLVGHYGGDVTDDMADSDVKILPAPGVEVLIVNGNELTLTVKFTIPGSISTGSGAPEVTRSPSVKLKYEGKEIDLLNDASITASRRKIDGNIEAGNTATYTWVLDSLVKSGGNSQQFKDLFSPSDSLAFGKDFTVTAGLALSANGYIDGACYAKAEDNSLFAKGSAASGNDDTAFIANLRHLQNLHSDFSKVDGSITKAEQTADIECKEYKNNQGASLDPNYEFTPILNSSLGEYDGKEKEIRRLTTVKNGDNAGLFQEIDKTDTTTTSIRNVRLIAPDVKGTTNAGGLVGEVKTACTFENCRVYWDTPEELVTGSSINYKVSGRCAGGLIGCIDDTANIKIANSFAAATVKGETVGGLIGKQNGATVNIEKSYADCYLSGTSAAGGLIGDGSPTLSNCYAAGFIVEPGGSVKTAGLVNGTGTGTTTVSNCYSVVRVLKKDTDGKETLEKPATPLYSDWNEGVVGGANSFYLSTAADVTDEVKSAWGTAFEYESGRPETHVYDLRYEMSEDDALKLTPPYPFPGLTGMTGAITIPHYGDWAELGGPEPTKDVTLELVYYEGHGEEGKQYYGFRFSKQFIDQNPTVNANTLTEGKNDDTRGIIRRDGYALAVKNEDLKSLENQVTTIEWSINYSQTWTLNYSENEWKWSGQKESAEVITDNDRLPGYTLITLPVELVYGDKVPITSSGNLEYYQKLTITAGTSKERVFYFNPHLPIEIVGPGEDGSAPKNPGLQEKDIIISIRTPRHFYDLSRSYYKDEVACAYPQVKKNTGKMRTFIQEFDLDYSEYYGPFDANGRTSAGKSPFLQKRINSGVNSSTGTTPDAVFIYDGQYHCIRNVFIESTANENGEDYFGLFKQIDKESELRNIVFEMVPGDGKPQRVSMDEQKSMDGLGKKARAAGALLGYNSTGGKVINCAVYGVNMIANAAYTGGLVGECNASSIIEGCSAELVCLDGTGNIGGLVGVLFSQSASLNNSYAVGRIKKSSGTEGICGLVGSTPYSKAPITGCYAAVYLEGDGSKYGLCPSGNVKNCYWLKGTFRYRGVEYTVDDTTYNSSNNKNDKAITPYELAGKFETLTAASRTVKNIPEDAVYAGDYTGPFPYCTGVTGLKRDVDGNIENVEDTTTVSIHYGLWPVEIPPEVTMFYYEKYTGETGKNDYGVYQAIREEGENPVEISTLDNDRTIVIDGYALAVKKKDLPWFVSTSESNKSKVSVTYSTEAGNKGNSVENSFFKDGINFKWEGLNEDESIGTEAFTLTVGETEYVMLPLWKSVHTDDLSGSGFFKRLDVQLLKPDGKPASNGTRTFFFNPHFAKALSCPAEGSEEEPAKVTPTNEKNQTLGDGTVPIYVRTARHFYSLSQFNNKYVYDNADHKSTCYYFLQERDVDYKTYTGYGLFQPNNVGGVYAPAGIYAQEGVYAQPVIGKGNYPNPDSNASFNGTYDGGGHRLKNVVFDGKNINKWGLGLFGSIGEGGCLRDIIYEPGGTANVNCNISKSLTKPDKAVSLYVGGLAGTTYMGKIENCAVLGFNVNIVFDKSVLEQEKRTPIENFYVGSLVGLNQYGTISNCFAEVRNLTVPKIANVNATSFTVGALAGGSYGLKSYKAVVKSCYAVGVIEGGSGARIAGLVGRSGHKDNNYSTIQDSYSAVALKGKADMYNICSPYKYGTELVDKIMGEVKNCYYLSDTWKYDGKNYTTGAQLDATVTEYEITAKTYDQLEALTGADLPGMSKVAGADGAATYPFLTGTKRKNANGSEEFWYFGTDWPKPEQSGGANEDPGTVPSEP